MAMKCPNAIFAVEKIFVWVFIGRFETNLRRIQLEKEIALADAEEEAIKLVMNEEVKNDLARKDAKSDERFEESFCEAKFDVGKTVIKHEPSLLRPDACSSFRATDAPNKKSR